MTTWLIAALLIGGFSVLAGGRKGAAIILGSQSTRQGGDPGSLSTEQAGRRRLHFTNTAAGSFDRHELPMFVRQLAALLKSGRSSRSLWQDAAAVYETAGALPVGQAARSRLHFAEAIVPVLNMARLSADLGYSISDCLRRHGNTERGAHARTGGTHSLAGMWADIVLCLDVAERSGAPLAALLTRYADQLEAELDAEAVRETALAAPRATVRLLTWLPLFGLGLGMLTGADPLHVLLGTPVGWTVGSVGIILMVLGRYWSSRIVASAARPVVEA